MIPGKPAVLAKSYRPITLLPVLSKLFETFLFSRLSNNGKAKNNSQLLV